MSIIDNLQEFTSGASGVIGSSADAIFKRAMDTVMVDLGRDIIVELPPGKSDCPDVGCTYDSFYERYMSSTGAVCSTCKGQGFVYEPRRTVYRSNIRWTNEPLNLNRFGSANESNMDFGRRGVNFVRTKTVAASKDDINNSVGATVDGIKVELYERPSYTAFGNTLYVVAFWKVVER